MSTKEDYTIIPGQENIELNAAGQALLKERTEIQQRVDKLDEAWVGAYLAKIFAAFPELISFKLAIDRTGEYDDEGGTYWSTSAEVQEATSVVDGEVVVDDGSDDDEDELDEDDDSRDGETLAEEIYQMIEDDLGDIAEGLGLGERDDGTFFFNGALIADLLRSGQPVSGREVFDLIVQAAD